LHVFYFTVFCNFSLKLQNEKSKNYVVQCARGDVKRVPASARPDDWKVWSFTCVLPSNRIILCAARNREAIMADTEDGEPGEKESTKPESPKPDQGGEVAPPLVSSSKGEDAIFLTLELLMQTWSLGCLIL
jgi:hypothetical protein